MDNSANNGGQNSGLPWTGLDELLRFEEGTLGLASGVMRHRSVASCSAGER